MHGILKGILTVRGSKGMRPAVIYREYCCRDEAEKLMKEFKESNPTLVQAGLSFSWQAMVEFL